MADPLALTNQVTFAKCVSQCLNVPAPVALSVVILFDFPRGLFVIRDVIYPFNAMSLDPSGCDQEKRK